jgi:hypothetical protein
MNADRDMMRVTEDAGPGEVAGRAVIAQAADEHMQVTLRASPPVTLHDEDFWRTDGNSPVQVGGDGVTVFFSDYAPRGRTFRRRASRALRFEDKASAVRLLDDPDPQVGKWIEAVWKDTACGVLRGWYHAEEVAPCAARLFVPHIGELISEDDGVSWRCRGELLRAPPGQIDCSWQNGFFAGGYGDLCVVPDRLGRHLYMPFTSCLTDENFQGIVMARMPAARPPVPAAGLELWGSEGWRPAADRFPQPILRPARGWRHVDPDCFWGPAVHYNRALDAYVMLLNHTADGDGDLVQEGIYASINRALDNPAGWSPPLQIVRGGAWYPEVVGLEDGCGDAEAGGVGRFFMAGFSAWSIEFARPGYGPAINHPLHPTKADFARLFGVGKRCPW